ncbi:MAG: ABC transporter substrate-binding protein [Pseudolysinimonas sp.]|uniref:ABC transporter substrate-binding protein n=1 Tax=Pseudolysinimonas sp. TaxID=2680009 RepID=UPI00326383C2
MKNHLPWGVAAVAAAALILTGCSGPSSEPVPSGSAEMRTVRVAALPIVETSALWGAIGAGIFRDHNIDVEVVPAQGGAQAIPALLSGDVQFAVGQPFGPFRAQLQDLGIVVLSNYASSLETGPDVNAVVSSAASGITTIAGLAGKRVSVNSLGAAGDVTIMAAVKAAGGDPTTIQFVEVAFPDAKAQLDAGNIDAAWVPEPFVSQIVGGGGNLVMYPYQQTIPGLPLLVNYTTNDLIKSDPQLVDDFTAAMSEALDWATANEPLVRQAIKDNLQVPEAVADHVPLPHFTATLDKDKIEKLAHLAVDLGVLPSLPDFTKMYR